VKESRGAWVAGQFPISAIIRHQGADC